jgi:Flp pilus assembly protein protease CpaA
MDGTALVRLPAWTVLQAVADLLRRRVSLRLSALMALVPVVERYLVALEEATEVRTNCP